MSTTRRRRIHAHNQKLRVHEVQRRHRSNSATAQVSRIQRFDDTLAKLMTWVAIAVLVLIATLVVIA